MSIARVTMHELIEEGMHDKIEALYSTIVDEYFPNLEQVINIKTGPTSAISKPESYELLLETDTKLVYQGVDVTVEGRFPVKDVWTNDGNKITSCASYLDK